MKKDGTASKNIFVRFWNWLKNTAWIQPLLIVGIIFAIIFSIPAISNAIQENRARRNSPMTYYANYQITLDQTKEDNLYDFIDAYFETNDEENPLIGQKFFLVVVQEGCAECEAAQEAFKLFQDTYKTDLNEFDETIKTIFADEETDETLIDTPFKTWLQDDGTIDFLYDATDTAENSPYYLNHYLGTESFAAADSVLAGISESSDSNPFVTPTIFLIDFTTENENPGVVETFVTIPGNSNVEKAAFLYDAWTGQRKFAA